MVKEMFEPFPLLSSNEYLVEEDFRRFSRSFAVIVGNLMPTAAQVSFLVDDDSFKKFFDDDPQLQQWLSLFKAIQNGRKLCAVQGRYSFVSFQSRGSSRVVGVIFDTDEIFQKKVSEDWLIEKAQLAEREFLLLKQARVDVQTGLLNLSNLHYLLDTHAATAGLHLILVELVPKISSARNVLRYSQRCVTLLRNYIQNDTILHYLGQFTFALVLPVDPARTRRRIESGLVGYLRREGCYRVHIGSTMSVGGDAEISFHDGGRKLLDQAWTGLVHARKRGPFAFCDYELLAHPENHPLASPDRNCLRRLRRFWKNSDYFSLVQFRCSPASASNCGVLASCMDRGEVVPTEDGVLVFIDGACGDDLLSWAEEKIKLIRERGNIVEVSAGLSSYPFCNFKKTETVMNCKKALLHGDLLGPSSVVVFDGLSLNVSGDIYFGDGDLTKAVKEYRRGIECDDTIINLHNSLGVSFVMMNKLAPAMVSFKRALQIDATNFMALYNYGLSAQALGLKTEALSVLKKGLQNFSQDDGTRELVSDLELQIGILSCEVGEYKLALDFLLPWHRRNKEITRSGRAYYYLGAAYFGLENNGKAMEFLQRALGFNEYDDRAMHLLGRLYLEENEGDSIALSLCQKSVELEPADVAYRFHLARVQLRCDLIEEARDNLRYCLRKKDYKSDAQLYMARSYKQTGQLAQAKSWYKKIINQQGNSSEWMIKEAHDFLNL